MAYGVTVQSPFGTKNWWLCGGDPGDLGIQSVASIVNTQCLDGITYFTTVAEINGPKSHAETGLNGYLMAFHSYDVGQLGCLLQVGFKVGRTYARAGKGGTPSSWTALIDTGASMTSLSPAIVRNLSP